MPVPVEGFLHPLDLTARRQLEAVPLLQRATQAYLGRITERAQRQELFSEAVRLGPRQFPEYYRLLPPLCHALGMPEPALFLWERDGANAMSYGQTQPVIMLGLELVKVLEPAELQSVLAHECGHILARHTLYRQMARAIVGVSGGGFLSGMPGKVAEVASIPLQRALMNWYRKSEFTADRIASVVTGNLEAGQTTMAKLMLPGAPGPLNLAELAMQADEYDATAESSLLDRFLTRRIEGPRTHPDDPARIREMFRWGSSPAFTQQRQLLLTPPESMSHLCSRCGHPVMAGWLACRNCGFRSDGSGFTSEHLGEDGEADAQT
jgi:Zn-dependent protease with chaperone function